MYKIGDEVIEKSTGRKGRIISMAEMAEMCYELKFPDTDYKALRFAREITPANTACTPTGGSAPASAVGQNLQNLPLFQAGQTPPTSE